MTIVSLFFYLLLAAFTLLIYYIRRNLNYWKDRGIPHDAPHLLYGNVKGFRKTRLLQDIYADLYAKYKGTGPFCGIYFFQRPTAFVLDTQLAKNILITDFANFSDRGFYYNERDDPLTGHLFALDGIKWKQLRQKLTPTFTSGKMRFMFPTVVKVAEQFVEVFGDLVEQQRPIEVRELLARFTTDVIGTCAFGIECNSLRDPNAEFRLMGNMAFRKPRHGNALMGFMFSFPNLARRLRMRQLHEDVHQFFMRIVRETVEYREQHNIKRNDFMDLLIQLKNTKSIKTEEGELLTGLTVGEVAAQAFVFFLAGFETSSTTMAFTLYELAQHQDIQQQLRDEVLEKLAKYNQEFTYECMQELRYMDQVISETLRLYTIIPNLSRQALNDYIVPGQPNYVIEKGTRVIIPAVSFHHDPEIYPEPYLYKPERFTPELVAQRESVQWLAFGDGPRNCIGMRFGKMQSRIGLALLIKNFKFSVCEETKIPIEFDPDSIFLAAKGGIQLRVQKLQLDSLKF